MAKSTSTSRSKVREKMSSWSFFKKTSTKERHGAISLVPFILFVGLFVGTGVYFTLQGLNLPFSQISPTVAILPAVMLSILLGREKIEKTIGRFIEGAGDVNIVTMVFIFMFAGAYVEVAKSIGGIDSTVNFALHFISDYMILPGIFITASFISFSIGTSMGTIAAVAPIAVGIAESTGISMGLSMGALLGGAMFGDNLSMISDTTIASVNTQGAELKDKFRLNFALAFPAMVLTILLLATMGESGEIADFGDYTMLKIYPYIAVLILALIGVNVLVTLTIGILFAGAVGLLTVADYTLIVFSQRVFTGLTDSVEIIILSMMIGGLGHLIKHQGGLDYLIHIVMKWTKKFSKESTDKKKVGEYGICALSALTDACTANNTVAILVAGDASKKIADNHGIDARRSACLIDIFSCVIQGIIPYSAQILLISAIAGISPFAVIPHAHYCFILGIITLFAVAFQYPRDLFFFKNKAAK